MFPFFRSARCNKVSSNAQHFVSWTRDHFLIWLTLSVRTTSVILNTFSIRSDIPTAKVRLRSLAIPYPEANWNNWFPSRPVLVVPMHICRVLATELALNLTKGSRFWRLRFVSLFSTSSSIGTNIRVFESLKCRWKLLLEKYRVCDGTCDRKCCTEVRNRVMQRSVAARNKNNPTII